MATKFGQKRAKLNETSCLDRIDRHGNVVNGSEDAFLRILVPICGLIKKNVFHYFSQKSIKLPIPAIVKMPNIQIGITSFVYKISTQSLRI